MSRALTRKAVACLRAHTWGPGWGVDKKADATVCGWGESRLLRSLAKGVI